MRIRWKLFLVLLAVSLIPALAVKFSILPALERMGADLATRSGAELENRSSKELKRLVEDHARVLGRERDLIEMALETQAQAVERALGSPVPDAPVPFVLSPRMGDAILPPEAVMSESHCRKTVRGECVEMLVSYAVQAFRLSSGSQRGLDDALRLSVITPVLAPISRKHPDLIMWRMTALENGVFSIYPAPNHIPMMYSPRASPWFRKAMESSRPVWTVLPADPLTGRMALVAALRVSGPGGRSAGVTAIAEPMRIMLHENVHVTDISTRMATLLVRPEEKAAGGGFSIRILAQKGKEARMHDWRFIESGEWLDAAPGQGYNVIVQDMRENRSGVRRLSYEGRESLLAFSPIGGTDAFLLLVAPLADAVAEAVEAERYVLGSVKRLVLQSAIILGAVFLIALGASLVGAHRITANIHKLVEASRSLARGNFNIRANVRSSDELGELGRAFDQMVPALKERMKIKETLNLAMEIQQNLLPRFAPDIPGLDIAGLSVYCEETGGDLYDFLPVGPGALYVAIGDVSGHGIPAALLMATVRGMLRARILQGGSLADIVTDVNELLASDTLGSGHFVTLTLTRIDTAQDSLRWVRAGHEPGLLYSKETEQISELLGPGIPLGALAEQTFTENEISGLRVGDVLFLGTDGVTETMNAAGEMFGRERLKGFLRYAYGSTAQKILDGLIEELRMFRGESIQEDDVTAVVVKKVRPLPDGTI